MLSNSGLIGIISGGWILIAIDYFMGQDDDAWMVNAHDLAMGEPFGSIYIPLVDAMNEARIFSNALSYKKGGSIVHMIRFMLDNDTLFFF